MTCYVGDLFKDLRYKMFPYNITLIIITDIFTFHFQILLHTPGEIPQVSKQYLRVPFNQELLISIKPKIITTSDGLKHYEPAR